MFFLGLTIENVIIRPFPFIVMKYVSTIEDFNASPELIEQHFNISFKIPLNELHVKDLRTYLIKFKIKDFGIFEDDLNAAVLATRSIIHNSQGNSRRNINQIINHHFSSICSENSKIFSAFMQSIGYISRVIWMCGHTVSEIYLPNSGWILIDTHGNIAFKDINGRYMNLLSISKQYQRAKPVNLIKSKYENCKDYIKSKYFQKQSNNVFKTQKCFVILDGKSLFSFHEQHRKLTNIIRSAVFGECAIGRGIQYIAKDSKKFGNVGITFYQRFYY